ncbi:N-acetylmuramoyl-L-alanine amidase [Phocaeicola vulgatus]|uniref:N-acetylmuramoyl-L-alanine amidase n=7 Tax=Bacteroidaceae TaxID=815 RepID=UPI00398F8F25
MGTLEIIRRNGEKVRLFSKEPFCTLKSAAQNSSLMGDDNVQLSIVSSELLNLGKGDKIIVEGEEYTIRTKVNREMLSDNHYVHDATFYGVMYELMKSLYRNTDANGKSSKSTFDLTYNIRDFVKVLIYNVSRDYPGLWAFDEANCPDTEPRTISFARNNCLQVLQMLCSDREFDLEFLITQKDGVRTIHIGKFGAKVVPPGGNAFFEWGKGNGLYKLKEQKVDDKTIITRLWVEGGTTNIRSDYRDYSERLQLPFPVRLNKKEHKLWDGTIVPPQSEYIGISDDNKRYLEDGDLRDALGSDEDAVTYDNIFPKRTGTVTALVADDINSFIDDTMDFDLNEKDDKGTKYLINEVSAKINFISGKLAGQQFELAKKGGYDHATKRFTLIPFTDNRGLTIPTTESEAYRITEGDTYKITDIHLPKSYEDDAEEDLWYAGYNEFKPRTQARAQYQLTFERSYFLNALPSDSETTVFHVGNYVPVKDERFGIEKNIRIQKVTKNLLVEHDYTLTLSDITAISPITQTVVDVGRHETIIENNRLRDLTKARRGWRTTEELRTMVYDTDGYFDPENIKPNSIDTNMLTVGSKSQQFVLIDVILQANVNGISNRFDASAGVLAHLTIDDEIIKHWNMAAGSFTLSSPKGYYVFAKCSKKSTDGIWYVTQEQLKVEPTEDPNNYYFQVGILGSVHSDDDFRDFTTTYGFTRINGNTITTGKIITSDKECYLDLDGNKFRIGDSSSSIDWNVTAKRQLTLHNVRLLSDSGDTSHIGVFRGTYNPKYVYYAGDEVAYTVNGETCTYRYTNPTPSMGNLPTNSVYWSVVAKGSTGDKGESGLSVFYTYNDSETKPATPTGDGSTGGWHRTSSENVVWMSIKNAKTDTEGAWGIPFRVRGADGTSINIKGSKDNVSQLPTVGNSEGDAYLIGGNLYIWDGTNWKDVGAIKGEDGKSSYLHKKYSDDGGKTFTAGNGETPGRWLGLYVDMIPTDSDKPSAYKWSDTKGQDGTPGLPGEDGRTPYFHIKYSDNGGMSFTANNGEEPGDYIGQYTDYVQKDSDNPMDYTWALIKGESGTGGTDAGAGEYYEYRYAKNGSTLVPPDLDVNSSNPTGWSTEMPKVGALEYIWCTMAKKSGLADRTKFHLPIEANDTSSIADISGNGYNGVLGGGTVVKDGTRYALNLSGGMESRIPYDLPFGESFTLCFWMKSDQNQVKWMLNGYNGRHYVEKSIAITPNTWFHLAFRFNDRTVTVFKNGEQLHSGSVNIMAVGFAIYDDDVFGSAVYFDDIRLLMGALPVNDIASVMNGKADLMIQKWSTPIRVNPYDGEDGKPGVSVTLADVEYAQSTSNSVAPTTGWQTTAPTWINGRYIWSRTKVSYSDNTTTYTKAVCITGGKGSTGDSGVGVSSIIEQYYLSSSATSLLNGSWSTTRPTWKDKWYIWTRSVITYTNGTSDTTAAICVTGSKGDKGEDGKPGVSVTLADVEYAQSTSNSVAPTTGWQTTAPTWINGRYIWSRTKVSYSDNTTTYTKAVCITGGKGSTGDSGVGVSSIIEQYYLSSSATSLLNGSWSTTRPTWKDKWYIWTRSVITYTNGTSDTTAAICVTGSKGDKGEDGKPGVSVTLADVEYAQSTSNSVAPTTGWQTTAPTWINGRYIWSRTKVSYSDNTTTYTKAVCITGGKGSTGDSGVGVSSIIEQYYLSSSATSLLNGSWSTTRPTWKDKWYIWTRSVITYTNGTSDTTAAICVTGSKGDKGEDGKPGDKGEKGDSPVLVYRGIYDSSKTYYGNSKRLDAVKYNNQYYIVRIDAGTFSNVTPTTTSKWNTFGAQFETIATNLLLAEGANIGDWFIKGGKIVSTMGNGNRVELDASMARIYIESSSGGGDYALVDFGAKMTIDANRGIFETRAKNAPNYSNAVSYMSPTGIFSNMAGTDGMPASSGYTHRGAIVGLGFANVPARTWAINAVDTIVAGVYGRASNSGTAPAFGGFFYDLFAGGLIFGRKCITGTSNNTWYLNREDTVVIGYTSAASVVYLPASPKEGQVIFVKQWWRGYMRFRPRSGYLIYDDTSVNDYYDFGEGQGGMFVYTVGYVDGVKKQAWLVSRWKY